MGLLPVIATSAPARCMDSARTAVFASRCRQVPILYPSKLMLATSLFVIFARTGMCSRAHAIFTLPKGASLGSFTRLKGQARDIWGEYQRYTTAQPGPRSTHPEVVTRNDNQFLNKEIE